MAKTAAGGTAQLKDKVVVITGASSGIGRATAQAFLKAGAKVVMAARRGYLVERMAEEFNAQGLQALGLDIDVSRPEDVEHLALRATEQFGHVDVWINNAGVGVVGHYDEAPLRDHEQVIQTNLLGTMYGCYHALRHFRQRGHGTLINVSSMFGKIPGPYWASYVASKFAINGLSDALRQEVRQSKLRDVHICTVLPMTIDTPFFEHVGNYTGHRVVAPPPYHDAERVVEAILGLVGEPEDEVIVGYGGRVASVVHKLAPETVENLVGMQSRRLQFGSAPAEKTAGAVQQPVAAGTQVEGGLRQLA